MDIFDGKQIDYTDKDIGKTFNEWTILAKVTGTRNVICRCSCNKLKIVKKSNVTLGYSKSCGHIIYRNNIKDKLFGEWKVIEDNGGTYVTCRCSCGNIRNVRAAQLVAGASKSCGHVNNLEEQVFGYWTVIKDYLNGWALCRCTCGKIQVNKKANLVNKHTRSCGCMKGKLISQANITSLLGRTFGCLTVIKDDGYGVIVCRCKCKDIREYNKYSVTSGHTKSCGCMRDEYRYVSRFSNERSEAQKQASSSEGNLYNFIVNNFNHKPTLIELANALGLSYSRTTSIINDKLRGLIHYHPATSRTEKDIVTAVEEILSDSNKNIKYNIRSVIYPYELDIYIPELKIAIEFNGNYWHSAYFKDDRYHQNKSLQCLDKGIRLVHIYEYELVNLEGLKNTLYKILTNTENDDFNTHSIEISLDKGNVLGYINNGYKIVNITEPKYHIINDDYVIYDSGYAILEKV